jgi:outer membrane protein TolC
MRLPAPTIVAWLCAGAVLGGCNFAPDYHPPAVATAASYKEESGLWAAAAPADQGPRGAWWTQFGDPVLNGLETQVASANLDIKAALARFQQARAAAAYARAAEFPIVTATASATRESLSKVTANPPTGIDL